MSTTIRPFSGFPPATLDFLRNLGANNTKSWFDDHRIDYERDYLAPALAFIAAMDGPLHDLHPDVHAEPRVNGSLFRINRDVRFSKDKTPYKDHLDLFFWVGEGRSRDRPGFFFRLRADRLILGAGMHAFDARMLEAYRRAVLDAGAGPALETAVATARAAGASVEGVGYRKLPAGLDPTHPRAQFLRHNALHASFDEPIPASLSSPAFVEHCLSRFRPLAPLLAWVADL
jgi:uncharacterized protein (TIGR02453 family)